MPILLQIDSLCLGPKPFVKQSASWLQDLMYSSLKTPQFNFSLIKNLSISTCFVRSNWTGLFAILIAAMLSQWSIIVSFRNSRSSFNKLFNHIISHRLNAIALYSASAVDQATTACFLLCHETRLPPTNTQYPDVDLLSSLLLPNLHHSTLPNPDVCSS